MAEPLSAALNMHPPSEDANGQVDDYDFAQRFASSDKKFFCELDENDPTGNFGLGDPVAADLRKCMLQSMTRKVEKIKKEVRNEVQAGKLAASEARAAVMESIMAEIFNEALKWSIWCARRDTAQWASWADGRDLRLAVAINVLSKAHTELEDQITRVRERLETLLEDRI